MSDSLASNNFKSEVVDDTEILYQHETESTLWVVWKQRDTGKLSLALRQNGQVVSICVSNILYFCNHILPAVKARHNL